PQSAPDRAASEGRAAEPARRAGGTAGRRAGGQALPAPARLRSLRGGLSRLVVAQPPGRATGAMDLTLPDPVFALPGDADAAGVAVAFSGGLDSTVLLHRLAALPGIRERGLRALHVHHGLHDHADAWARRCEA